jgi:hypothetical protein
MRSLDRRVLPLTTTLFLWLTACADEAKFSSGAGARPQQSADVTKGETAPPIATPVATAAETPAEEPETDESIVTAAPEEPADPEMPATLELPADPEVPVAPQERPMPVTIEQTFPAARFEELKVEVDPPIRYASQLITLREAAPVTATLRQLDRGRQQDAYTQGHDPNIADPEQFALTRAGELDLIVIVDDSNSMADEQANLSTKLSALLSSISNTDWQIRVVTTSDPCPRNNRIIRAGDADAAAAFKNAVEVPIVKNVVEKGLPMGLKALAGECNGVTTPWLRSDSAVALLVLSDEENCSSPYADGCPGEFGDAPQDMIDYLATIRPDGNARFYAIIEGPGDPCRLSAWEAAEYKAVVDATGGAWGSICEPDYSATLATISANVSRIVARRFPLAHVPDPGTLMLTIDGKQLTSGFRVEGKTLILEPNTVDVDDLKLVVTYSYGATPKFDRVTLSRAAAPGTLTVKVGSETLKADAYTYDAATRELVFDEMPADDTIVVAKYRPYQPLPKRFEQATAFRFDPAGPAIELQTAPADGVEIAVRHRSAAGRMTRYPAAFAGKTILPMGRDAQTGASVPVQLDQGEIIIAADDVVDGRRVAVTFDLGDTPQELTYDLGHEPVPGSVSVVDENGNDVCDAQTVGTVVELSCEPAEAGSFTLNYSHVVEYYSTFTLPGQFAADAATWEVWVDGQRLDGFTRDGYTVTIAADLLAPDSEVKVAATYLP